MSLVYNDDERMLLESARAFLAAESPVAALRARRGTRSEDGFSRELWAKMAEMGWAGLLVPEPHGGLDFSHTGAGILCEQAGRTLAASPLFATAILGVSALRLAGNAAQQAALLPAIVEGRRLLALASDETARHDPLAIATSAVQQGDGWVLNGTKQAVLDGHVAHTFVVAARTAGDQHDANGISLFLVDAGSAGLRIDRCSMLDSRNAARLQFDGVKVASGALLGVLHQAYPVLERTLDIGRICLAAELLGIAAEVFERTLAYLRQRRQFGKLIGEFQALQHRAARLFCDMELARSAVMHALRAIDEDDAQLGLAASLAKARACETATLAVNEAVQMHGGIGMTDEFEIGFFMKRAAAARTLFGDAYFHTNRYAVLGGY
jgi:alkylation response protein AidB-like acyl-CoA dehydrogenase